jgi:CubicO group peptidase (beta-lactamase class C family)
VHAADGVGVLRAREIDARAHDVVDGAAGLLQGALDDLQTAARLAGCVARRVGVVRHRRRGPGDVDASVLDDGARVSVELLPRLGGGDQASFHGVSIAGVDALRLVERWPARHVAAGVVDAERELGVEGERERVFAWASVTKLLTAVAMLVAVEEGTIDLDEPAGPPESTVRHLLSHASGLALDAGKPIAPPGRRRIYSNRGIELATNVLAERAGMPFRDYFRAAVVEPLGLAGDLHGSPASGYQGPLGDLMRFGRELLAPTLLAPETLAEATTVQFPGLDGVLPSLGRQTPNDWGLGFELRDAKSPHWTGTRNSPQTFGHFGASGTFLWVDPDAGVALGVLTDLSFGDWAKESWPELSDAVLAELGR